MSLKQYRQKRDFKHTKEPKGSVAEDLGHLYIIQKHDASHLHYDFRLELNGVLLSWAIPKGPSLDPKVKRLAIHVEDHPVAYGSFEGIIPKGQYGGGTVMLWDKGIWKPLDEDSQAAYKKGHLRFELIAEKLNGRWDLLRFKDEKHWFLIKYADQYAKPSANYDILTAKPKSVLSKKTTAQIAAHHDHIWTQSGAVKSDTTKPKRVKKKKSLKLPKNLTSAPFPQLIKPQLATLTARAPDGDEWLHEVKFDGYRILAFIDQGKVILKSRTNKDWTSELMTIHDALHPFLSNTVVFDGEAVLLDAQGKSSFQLLQNAIKTEPYADYVYYIFDLIYFDGFDLKNLPLSQRKALLKELLKGQKNTLRFSDHIVGHGKDIFQNSCELGLEGIVSKQAQSVYASQRSRSWLKVKCSKRQEFVIGGYTQPQGERDHFGALLLGVYNEDGKLDYCGNVGTGFNQKSLTDIDKALQSNRSSSSPFHSKIPQSSKVTWVQPTLVAEIEFTEWTEEGHLRHPSFKGLRVDKPAHDVIREQTTSLDASMNTKPKAATTPLITLTHPEKILYPEDKISKQEILDYYDMVSEYMLPYTKNRPLSLLRCPDNYSHCFFQRHYTASTPNALKPIEIEHKEATDTYIYLTDKTGLLSLVQMGVLEIHPWGSQIAHLETPDFIVIDLDPAPELPWKKVVEAAFDIKSHLQQFGLTSFVKTTGGKGLHIMIPIQPEYDWNTVKEFTHVFVQFLEKSKPKDYVSTMSKSKRSGKIFVDYLRNLRGATAVGAYSTRARLHAPVSVPIHWDELTNNRRDTSFTVKTLGKRLASLNTDPWENFLTIKQSLRLDELDLL